MRIVLILIFLACFSGTKAQPVFFETNFGTPFTPEFSYAVRQLPSGTIYCGGYSAQGPYGGNDVAVYHLSRDGQLAWIKYYGDSLNNAALYLNTCSDGNLILVGETEIGPGDNDIGLWKIDTSGNLIWYKHFGGAQNQSAKFVMETADSGFIFSGFRNAGSANDAYVIKTDSAGNFSWELALGGSDNDYASKIVQLGDGTYAVSYDSKQQGHYDVGVARFDNSGALIWDNLYGSVHEDGSQGLIETSDGNLVVYGEAEISMNSPFDFFHYKINLSGDTIWLRRFGGALADAMFGLREMPGGQMMGCGYSNSFANGPISVAIVNTDTSGHMNWVHMYGGTGIDIGYDIIPSIDGGWLVTGITTVGSDGQGYLLHLDNAGWASVGEKEKTGWRISPNPGSGMFLVEHPESRAFFNIRAYDLTGREVFSLRSNEASFSVDLRSFPDGVYLLSAEGETGIFREKLVINHQ